MYEPVMTEPHNPPPEARRRNGDGQKLPLKQRLANIVSMYVPATSTAADDGHVLINIGNSEEVILLENEQTPLNEQGDVEEANTAMRSPYRVRRMMDLSKLMDEAGEPLELSPSETICGGTLGENCIYLQLKDSATLLRVPLDDAEVQTATRILLRFNDCLVYPYQIQFAHGALYVSGRYAESITGQELSLILKYDPEGQLLCKTRQYAFPRFSALTVDADGSLLVTSPQAKESSDCAQVFKISPGFERKAYSLRLGNSRASYQPMWVAGHCVGGRAWVSVVRKPLDTPATIEADDGDLTQVTVASSDNTSYRLISFPCCRPSNQPEYIQTKDWLKVESWNFQSLAPGQIASLGDRLLVIDSEAHNLNYVFWDAELGHACLQKISKPGSGLLRGVTTRGDDAYLFTDHTVFHFRFQEEEEEE